MTAETITKYVGIADCYGLEYFGKPETIPLAQVLPLRASTNRQRHAVYFEADLTADQAERVEREINNQNFEEALNILKAFNYGLELSGGGNVQGSWDLIPNPSLDPWG